MCAVRGKRGAKGLAYESEQGSWYFNVAKKEGYSQQLVSLDAAAVEAAGRRDADEYDADKVGVQDFALWKAFKLNLDRDDATWDTDIAQGRPGWHLECSAMAKKFLGETIDFHCGGIDLKFPHHENKIAQSEVRTTYLTFGTFIDLKYQSFHSHRNLQCLILL